MTQSYRLCNPHCKKIIVLGDVEFDNQYCWSWTEKEKHVRGMFLEHKDDKLQEIEKSDKQSPPPSPAPATPIKSSA